MNEFERKLYLKYRNIENMMQFLCLTLYQLRLFIQVNTYILLCFTFFTFFKRIYFQIAQEEFKQPIIPHKKVSQDLTEMTIVLMVLTKI